MEGLRVFVSMHVHTCTYAYAWRGASVCVHSAYTGVCVHVHTLMYVRAMRICMAVFTCLHMCMLAHAYAVHRRACVQGVLPEVERGLTHVLENWKLEPGACLRTHFRMSLETG